jgi:hypothetical protein
VRLGEGSSDESDESMKSKINRLSCGRNGGSQAFSTFCWRASQTTSADASKPTGARQDGEVKASDGERL